MSKPEIYLTELEEFNKRIEQIIDEQERLAFGAAKDEPQVEEVLELTKEPEVIVPAASEPVTTTEDLISTFVATYANHPEPTAILPTKKYYNIEIIDRASEPTASNNVILDSAVILANSFGINPTTAREWFKKKRELSNEKYILKLSNYGE
jgi:hypothetical protein